MMVNDKMPEYCVERAGKILNEFKKALNGSMVLILGVAYKQDIDDYRESPAINVIEEFKKVGSKVDYYDPYVKEYKHDGNVFHSIEKIDNDIISQYDLVVITTAHTNIDYEMVSKYAKFIFDTKNATKGISNRENIELL